MASFSDNEEGSKGAHVYVCEWAIVTWDCVAPVKGVMIEYWLDGSVTG